MPVPEDLSLADWPERAAGAGLTTISLHHGAPPKVAVDFIESPAGREFLARCARLRLQVGSQWKRPAVKFPWRPDVLEANARTYAQLGLRHVTTFAVWIDGDYVKRFGEPVDAYVNGSQVWLRDDGPGDVTVEWRLHPVAGYRLPPGLDTYDVLSEVARALAAGEEPPALLDRLWDGLEAFPAYGDEVEPATLAATVADALGIPPDAAGLVDHRPIGDEWERSEGAVSVVARLLDQLGAN